MKHFWLIVLTFLVTSNVLRGQNQSANSCPQIEIVTPAGSYLGLGDTYNISANIGLPHNSEIKYIWTFHPNIPFNKQGKAVVSFLASEDLNGMKIKVSLKVDGLPQKCLNSANASFQIWFNPGTPLTFDTYGKLPLNEERERLANLAEQLAKLSDANAYFVLSFKPSMTRTILKTRVRRIITTLKIYGIEESRLLFTFSESDRQSTTIYASPQSHKREIYTWENTIDMLRIPRRLK